MVEPGRRRTSNRPRPSDGSEKVVQVYRLITKGTIEEKIHALQQRKRELIENVIQPGETNFTSLSENEIRELLNV